MDKTWQRKNERARPLRGGTREARTLAVAEIHLEAPPETHAADPLEPPLDRAAVQRVIGELADRLVPEGSDEWSDGPTEARLIVSPDRILVHVPLPSRETRDELALRLDRIYDLVFEIANPLRLEVVDPQLGTVVTRFRYEQQFQRVVDVYYTRARTAAALAAPSTWKDLGVADAKPGTRLPAIEAEPEALPASVWGRRRPLGVLEFSGERTLATLERLTAASPFLAVVPPNAVPGDDAAVLRVRRLVYPISGLALVEVGTEGLSRIHEVHRGEELHLTVVPREI